MSYLNPPYENNFKELCAAMPLYYLEVREMRAILRTQGRLLDGVCGGMEQLVDVNFILTADDSAIRQWEQALEIFYKGKPTLEQRKRVVIGYLIGLGHIGEKEIREIIRQYTPNHVDFSFWRGHIGIVIDGEIFDEDNLVKTLLKRIPAHLGLDMYIHIRREFRQTVPFARGGLIGAFLTAAPVVQDRESVQEVGIHFGGLAETSLTPFPVGEDRDSKFPVLTAHGALQAPAVVSAPPDPKRTHKGHREGAGGAYAHSHIKSRRVD